MKVERPNLAPATVCRAPSFLRSATLLNAPLLVSALLLAACASDAKKGPAWPEEAGPSYPEPPAYQGPLAEIHAEQSTSTAPATPAPSQAKSSTAKKKSALAEEYSDAKAIDTLKGKASYYADSLAGNHTANGDIYDPKLPTAAHKKLPFGTILRVTRVDNGLVTYVRVNDRGPFGDKERIIDLSRSAAEELQMMKAGVVEVKVEIVDQPSN